MINFAIDFGNGFVKASSERKRILAPSSIAREEDLGSGSLDNVANLTNKNKDYHIFHTNLDDSRNYAWGTDIEEVAIQTISTHKNKHRYKSESFKMLCQFVLSELASDYTEEELNKDGVMLVTGMPSQEIGTEEEKHFKNFLEQKHLIKRDGKQKLININVVKIVEQPVGSLLDLFMTDEGKLYKTLEGRTFTIIDFGAGTTIIDTFKNLKRNKKMSDTLYKGINNLFQDIQTELKGNSEHKITMNIVNNIKEGFRNGSMSVEVGNQRLSFEDIAKDKIHDYLQEFIPQLENTLRNTDSVDTIVLTGGGLNIVRDSFKDMAKDLLSDVNVEETKDSQNSNLRGFYKLSNVLSK